MSMPAVGAAMPAGPEPASARESPRRLDRGLSAADRAFFGGSRAIGATVLLITGAIGIFLFLTLPPTLHAYGFRFFTEVQWLPQQKRVGVAAALVGTFQVAAVAVVVSVPLALVTALFITEYAPRWISGLLISVIDLMAAIPSIIYGLWGFFLFEPHAAGVSRWITTYLSWIPIFHTDFDPQDPNIQMAPDYYGSVMIGGLVVAMMVIPIMCALMRGVFAQAPPGEREGALALGATRWGVIRAVVLPFGRGGIIGGTMLGLGRALGETIAVLLVINQVFAISFKVLQSGSLTVASLIAGRWSEATPGDLVTLISAGFILFVITLIVNFVAAIFITRSRSGALTEI